MSERCEKSTHLESFIIDAFFHIFVLSLVLGLFFFFVVAELERKSLNNEIENAITKGIEQAQFPSPPQNVKDGLKTLSKIYDKENEADKTFNQGLIRQCILVLITLALGLFSVWLTMKWSAHKCPKIGIIMLQNLLLFGSIGVIEYLFFTQIARKFIPVMPSYMAEVISKKLK